MKPQVSRNETPRATEPFTNTLPHAFPTYSKRKMNQLKREKDLT